MLKRIAIGTVMLGVLSACQPAVNVRYQSAIDFAILKPDGVRVGLTAAELGTRVEPKNLLRVQYILPVTPQFPFPATVDFKLNKTKMGFDGLGSIRVALPIEELGEVIQGLKEATGRTPNLDGRHALVPLRIRFDSQMRSTFSDIMGRTKTESPNDCFAMVGVCKSTQNDSISGISHRIFTTFEEGGRFYTVKRRDPRKSQGNGDVLELFVYSVDKYGLPIDIHSYDIEEDVPTLEVFNRKY